MYKIYLILIFLVLGAMIWCQFMLPLHYLSLLIAATLYFAMHKMHNTLSVASIITR
jgi:hypothetical protein